MNYASAKLLARKEAFKVVAEAGKVNCPLKKKCGLLVLVYDVDTSDVIKGATVNFGVLKNETTDGNGIARRVPTKKGTYKIHVTKVSPASKILYEDHQPFEVTINLGECPVVPIPLTPLPKLVARVVEKGNHGNILKDAFVEVVAGPQKHKNAQTNEQEPLGATNKWAAKFGYSKAGTYKLKVVELSENDQKRFRRLKDPVSYDLQRPTKAPAILEVEPIIRLRVVLIDKQDKAISGVAWQATGLPTGATPSSGKTGGDGLIEVKDWLSDRIPSAVTVKATMPAPAKATAPSAPKVKATAEPPYPPPVKAEDFTDKDPAAPPDDRGVVQWTLTADRLRVYDDEAGIKSRLGNMGFHCDSGSAKPPTTAAVKRYQKHYLKKKDGTGAPAEIKGDILNRHDKKK